MNKIEEIKKLYKQVDYKTGFLKSIAENMGKSPVYLKNHWFSGFWCIPTMYHLEVVSYMENYVKTQNL